MSARKGGWPGPAIEIRLAASAPLALILVAVHLVAAAGLVASALALPWRLAGLVVVGLSLAWHLGCDALRLYPRAAVSLTIDASGGATVTDRTGARERLVPVALSPALLAHRLELRDAAGRIRVLIVPHDALDEAQAHALRVTFARASPDDRD